MKKIYLLLILTIVNSANAENRQIQNAFDYISKENVTSRYYSGGFSMIFGGTSALTGWNYTNDKNVTRGELNVGRMLLAIGSFRIWDGARIVLFKPNVERYAKGYSNHGLTNQGAVSILKKGKVDARRSRFLHASLISVTSLSYFYLSSFERNDHEAQFQTGLFLIGISFYKWFYPTPAEMALSKYVDVEKLNINLAFNGRKPALHLHYMF